MKSKKVLEIIKSKNIIIPTYLLKELKELDLNYQELIFLCYLETFSKDIPFNIELFHQELSFDIETIMGLITSLTDKKYLDTKVIKNDKGITEEYLNIDNFSNKVLSKVIDIDQPDNKETDIYSIIEKDFGRVLSPIEYEMIKKWLDNNVTEDTIKEAVKEAILNGVFNLRYVDKIIYEWGKKGYQKSKTNKQDDEEVLELFDYNWLEDNDE